MTTKLLKHRLRGYSHCLNSALGPNPNHQEQGLTLIECLVAIIMVALVSSLIAPTMVLSVATRVHSQKAEQALALAQSEIDSARVLVERGGYTAAQLPPLAAGLNDQDIETAVGPNLSVTDANNFAFAEPVDITGDTTSDFLVQRYRAEGQVVDNIPVAFAMGVRVYDGNATATGNLDTNPASLVMTSSEGGRSTRPLAVLYTTIATSDQGDSLCNLSTYLNGGDAPENLPAVCTTTP